MLVSKYGIISQKEDEEYVNLELSKDFKESDGTEMNDMIHRSMNRPIEELSAEAEND
jgi:hypothetical protein